MQFADWLLNNAESPITQIVFGLLNFKALVDGNIAACCISYLPVIPVKISLYRAIPRPEILRRT
jgi:hypothetical protein